MQITVNGQPHCVAAGWTITDVLNHQAVRTDLVAVEVNLEIVPKQAHAQTLLSDGDQIEIVTLVGGG
ncbi:MAG: sulfur carrier protein ThiS [Pirellulaceae bacterium]|nr:sulfur carrier protein ThiS [Pirellulaceae bacterium]